MEAGRRRISACGHARHDPFHTERMHERRDVSLVASCKGGESRPCALCDLPSGWPAMPNYAGKALDVFEQQRAVYELQEEDRRIVRIGTELLDTRVERLTDVRAPEHRTDDSRHGV